jgi:hypothetical protein
MASSQKNFQDHRRLSEKLLRVTGGFRKARTNSLKRITGKIFKLRKGFQRSKQKRYCGFSS